MPESWRSRVTRWGFNWFPAYRGTGARIEHIASDWTEVRIRLALSWRTRNYVGTIFGGSLYGAIDPIYMIMLIKLLGKDYEVWDKAAAIRFRKPGRSTLRATFRLDDGELDQIKREVATSGRTSFSPIRRSAIGGRKPSHAADSSTPVPGAFDTMTRPRRSAPMSPGTPSAESPRSSSGSQ